MDPILRLNFGTGKSMASTFAAFMPLRKRVPLEANDVPLRPNFSPLVNFTRSRLLHNTENSSECLFEWQFSFFTKEKLRSSSMRRGLYLVMWSLLQNPGAPGDVPFWAYQWPGCPNKYIGYHLPFWLDEGPQLLVISAFCYLFFFSIHRTYKSDSSIIHHLASIFSLVNYSPHLLPHTFVLGRQFERKRMGCGSSKAQSASEKLYDL